MKLITEITRKGEDYIAVEINGVEKELNKHDGQTIEDLMKVIKNIFRAYL